MENSQNNIKTINTFLFATKCIGGSLVLFLLWLIFAFFTTINFAPFSIIAILVYFIVSQIYIEYLMGNLWEYIGENRDPHRLTATLGALDRIIYALSFALKQYPFIGIWLGIKIASRLINYRTDPPIADDKEIRFKEEGEKRNVYIIGNAVSLLIGLSVGFLIRILPQYPSVFDFIAKIVQ